jgi:hypothetical protein
MAAMHPTPAEAVPYLALFTLVLVAASVFLLLLVISRIGGWNLLARRFTTREAFYGQTWGWQSAQFRGWCNYNHCLTIGADEQHLYLAAQMILRFGHPSLLIPWHEIEVETGKCFFGFYDVAKMRVGLEERLTLRVYGAMVNRLRQAAGPGWPLYAIEQHAIEQGEGR